MVRRVALGRLVLRRWWLVGIPPSVQRQAWAAALVLLGAILILNILIRVAAGRRVVSASRAD